MALLAGAVGGVGRAQSAAPVITSAAAIDDSGFSNDPFTTGGQNFAPYRITALNSPTSLGVTGLRSTDHFDAATGLIGIDENTPGSFGITVSASNASGTGSTYVQVTVHGLPQSLDVGSESGPFGLGSTVRISIHFNEVVYVTGSPAASAGVRFVYESGSGTRTLVFAHIVVPGDAAWLPYFATLDYSQGTIADVAGVFANVNVPGPITHAWDIYITGNAYFKYGLFAGWFAPATVGQPFSVQLAALNVTIYAATGLPPGLSLNTNTGVVSGTPTTAGQYTIAAVGYDASGNSDSVKLPITVAAGNPPALTMGAHLVNLSALAYAERGEKALVAGFSVTGNTGSTKPLLLRGIGPGLAQFGVSGAVTKAALALFGADQHQIYANDGWGTDPLLASIASQVGAFALTANSGDSAIVWSLYPGVYTIQATADTGVGGTALAEVYDAAPTDTSLRLINLSARADVGIYPAAGLVGGFTISGSGNETVLIRGIGPALAQFGITTAVSAPMLTLFDQNSQPIAQNKGWPATTTVNGAMVSLANVFAQVGAFPLPSGSADCALVVSLPAGRYSAQLGQGPVGGGSVGMIEIYEVSSP